jgi:hypothetical protein
MSRVGKFRKDAADRKRYVVDYVDWLDSAEEITAVTVTGDVPADAFYADGYVISDDKKEIIFFVSGGVAGSSYDVTFTITTSLSQIKEDWVTFVVT